MDLFPESTTSYPHQTWREQHGIALKPFHKSEYPDAKDQELFPEIQSDSSGEGNGGTEPADQPFFFAWPRRSCSPEHLTLGHTRHLVGGNAGAWGTTPTEALTQLAKARNLPTP